MDILKRHKWLSLLLGGVIVLGGAGAAFAFWSGGGSGSGSGTAGSGGTVTLTGVVGAGSAPGVSVPVTFKAANATTSPIRVASVHLVSITADAGHSGCVTADFTMADVAQGFEVPAGSTASGLPTNGSLAYADTAVSQDACKGATLTLTLSSV
jgi:hypothetical protein